jgi:catalase
MRPTTDSIYLAQKINDRWDSHSLSPAAIQNLVTAYGDRAVEDALRELHGFPPDEAVRSPYAYLMAMLKEGL